MIEDSTTSYAYDPPKKEFVSMSTIPGVLGHPQAHLFDPELEFNVEEYAIGGKMITVKMEVNPVDQLVINDEEWRKMIRQKLAFQLALAMLDQEFMETTTFEDPTSARKMIAARCFMTPKDQVKILRVHKR